MNKVNIDSSRLNSVIAGYAAATKKSAREAVDYAARQVAQHAQKETVLIVGRGNRGRASTVAQAKREQIALWEPWILKMGFPRMGYTHHRFTAWRQKSAKSAAMRRYWFSKRMSQKERKRYFAVAKKRQGEFAAGWNAAIAATGGKYAAAWVKRHGNKHGDFSHKVSANGEFATIKFQTDGKHESRGQLRIIADLAIKKTMHGMKIAAEKILAHNRRRK